MNVAVTLAAALIVTLQEPVPLHAPDHPVKRDPEAARAVSVTVVPDLKSCMQTVPQAIPPGELVTLPAPLFLTVSKKDTVAGPTAMPFGAIPTATVVGDLAESVPAAMLYCETVPAPLFVT